MPPTPLSVTASPIAAQLKGIIREIEHFEGKAAESRVRLYQLMHSAFVAGHLTAADLARVLGLSRQRVYVVLEEQRKLASHA